MSKLKNWTVTAESVKKGSDGLIAFHKYLLDASEHKGQIIKPPTSKNNLLNTIMIGE